MARPSLTLLDRAPWRRVMPRRVDSVMSQMVRARRRLRLSKRPFIPSTLSLKAGALETLTWASLIGTAEADRIYMEPPEPDDPQKKLLLPLPGPPRPSPFLREFAVVKPKGKPEAETVETFQEVKTAPAEKLADLEPTQPVSLLVGSRIRRVVNADIQPVRAYNVKSGTAGDTFTAWLPFGAMTQQVQVYCWTYDADVSFRNANGAALGTIHIVKDTVYVFDLECDAVKVKNNGLGDNSVYEVVGWI